MTHNFVRDWREFGHLSELRKLEDLCFIGNPLEEENSLNGKWLPEVSKRLLSLKKLDGYPLIRDQIGQTQSHDMFSQIFPIQIYDFFFYQTLCNISFDFLKCSKLRFFFLF